MILDTNALSAAADGEPGALARLAEATVVALPVIVLGEYRFGFAESRKRVEYERWLVRFVATCLVLDVTERTTVQYAELRSELKRAGTPIPANDAWIAALCREHALPILTRDGHFDLVKGLRRLSW
ncbi:MAG: type II toxin-antitoxin system VapC family toxin [Bryobacteraceae bacterium]|nr:type II toxin-antitoxin system VapC family toxin [Bryobacteraceae bacterium]